MSDRLRRDAALVVVQKHDPCATCTLITSTDERPWPVHMVKSLGLKLLGFGIFSGMALGVLGTLLVMRPWT